MTIPEMARKLEVSVPTITNHLKVLKEDGKVVRMGAPEVTGKCADLYRGTKITGDSVSRYEALGNAIESAVRKACEGKEVGIAFSGRRCTNSSYCAFHAASMTSSSVAPFLPMRMLSMMLVLKRTTSWNTMENLDIRGAVAPMT